MKIELMQLAGRDGDTAYNLQRTLQAISTCADDADLLVELSLALAHVGDVDLLDRRRDIGQHVAFRHRSAEAREAARYDYAAAVDRFKAGQDLARRGGPQVDHIEASIIDTRLRAVESLLREQAAER